MNHTKQTIVPVKLQDKSRDNRMATKSGPQLLVARLKKNQTELLIYEGINPSLLKILLTELSSNENR